MQIFRLQRLRNSRGTSILEVLIAALITGLITTAAFKFYTAMHHQAETQYDVSEIQHLCRASLHDMKKTLRMAGYKLTGHPSYEIKGDSLAIYFSASQPVDTILYFLEEYTDDEYAQVPDLLQGKQLWKLMKQRNSFPAVVFSNCITDINYTAVNSENMIIVITIQTSRSDDTYSTNNGFRTYSLMERVNIRNMRYNGA